MMQKVFAPLALALSLGLSQTMTAAPALADELPTAAQTAAAQACAQALGFAGLTGDTVVVVPRGAASVNLNRYDTGAEGKPAAGVTVSAFDLANCQPVELKIWVQDQLGATVNEQETAVATFPSENFATGVNYIRAQRALDRDLGFLLRGTN